jgi:hypothetical protein
VDHGKKEKLQTATITISTLLRLILATPFSSFRQGQTPFRLGGVQYDTTVAFNCSSMFEEECIQAPD